VKIIASRPAYGTYITPSPATNICIIEIQIPGAFLKKKHEPRVNANSFCGWFYLIVAGLHQGENAMAFST